jgi:transposase
LNAPARRPGGGCAGCQRLQRENQRLVERIAHLEGLLEEARRSAKRQAAPFSKGEPARQPLRPGRRPGAAYGRKARRPIPTQVDETLDAPLPGACPSCGGGVEMQAVADQYQTDIPPVRPRVLRFRVQIGACRKCGGRVQGRHPRQTSNALGAAASQLGPRAVALAADMNKGLGLPYGKVKSIFGSHFGIDVSRGGLCTALQRLAEQGQPTYDGLVETIQSSPVVSPDETGWKVAGHLRWLWAFVTSQTTVYAILDGRGYDEAARILGADFAGTLVRDGWAPYRKFTLAEHQSCLAHLLRRCHEMIEAADRGAARFPHAIRRILLASLLLRDRHGRQEVSDHGLLVAKGRLSARLEQMLQWNVSHKPNHVFIKHLRNEAPHLLTFLGRKDVPATNFQAEQAIRPAVVSRKVWGGNRTWRGAQTQQVLASILRTMRQRHCDPYTILERIRCSPEPMRLELIAPGNGPPR